MIMSESDDEEYLNCYSTSTTRNTFKKQIGLLKNSKSVLANPTLPLNSSEKELSCPSVNPAPIVSRDDSVSQNETPNCSSGLADNLLDDGFIFPAQLLVDTARPVLTQPEAVSPDKQNENCDNEVIFEEETRSLRRSKRNNPSSSGCLNQPFHDIVFLEEETAFPRRSRRNKKDSSKRGIVHATNSKPKINIGSKKEKKENDNIQEVCLDEDGEDSLEDDINYECNVKIIWKSADVVKIPVRRLQKLNVVFEHFMKEENVDLEKIILTLHGKTVKPTDTPESLNLTVTDFLDGGVVFASVSYQSCQQDDSKFSIKFQDCSKQIITLPIKYEDKMKAVLLGYAEQIDKPLTGLKFMFDGCAINYDDTPESLGMEKGDVVDVIVKN